MNIGIYIYDNAEVLDFSGPFEVFTTASRVSTDKDQPFDVFLISEFGGTVTARASYQVISNHSIQNHPQLDVLIVVGGVHTKELEKPNIIEWVKSQSEKVAITASVCTGAFLLAKANIIKDKTVTTHWQDCNDLREQFPNISVFENVRWVDEGNLVTSAGISAGIDMSLHLVSKLHSDALAINTAKQMEFDWTKNS